MLLLNVAEVRGLLIEGAISALYSSSQRISKNFDSLEKKEEEERESNKGRRRLKKETERAGARGGDKSKGGRSAYDI